MLSRSAASTAFFSMASSPAVGAVFPVFHCAVSRIASMPASLARSIFAFAAGSVDAFAESSAAPTDMPGEAWATPGAASAATTARSAARRPTASFPRHAEARP